MWLGFHTSDKWSKGTITLEWGSCWKRAHSRRQKNSPKDICKKNMSILKYYFNSIHQIIHSSNPCCLWISQINLLWHQGTSYFLTHSLSHCKWSLRESEQMIKGASWTTKTTIYLIVTLFFIISAFSNFKYILINSSQTENSYAFTA